jgi:hypothetical protein
MRIYVLLAGAMGLALAGASTAQAQSSTSWGPKHTTFWSSDSTGKFESGQFMTPSTPAMVQPVTGQQPDMRAPTRPQRMYYQAPGKKIRAQMRPRQQQPGMKPGAPEGAQPPDAKPSAPPARGQTPPQGDQPPQGQPPQGQPPQGQPK